MDQAVFNFLGIDHERLLDSIRNAKSDVEIEAFTRPFVDAKSREEIERWNGEWLSREPQGESAKAFENLRAQIAADRTDVTTWPDLLDIDEKRDVPRRTATVLIRFKSAADGASFSSNRPRGRRGDMSKVIAIVGFGPGAGEVLPDLKNGGAEAQARRFARAASEGGRRVRRRGDGVRHHQGHAFGER